MNIAPAFDRIVPPGGYVWWYLDGLSDDRRFGFAVICFVGSVFSPYYAAARQRGSADPLDYCSFNVALYLPRRHYWTMTERRRERVSRSASEFVVGPSVVRWEGDHLRLDVDEITAPVPMRVRGTIRLHPQCAVERGFALEPGGAHRWQPIAPRARVEVAFERPDLRWQGDGYFDTNAGDTPLESAFSRWEWSRAHLPDGSTAIAYDALPRHAPPCAMNLRIGPDGAVHAGEAGKPISLPRTLWGLPRSSSCDPGGAPRLLRSLEDGPFYARSLVSLKLGGESVHAVHESLSLDRFASTWVRMLLPFKMPRAP